VRRPSFLTLLGGAAAAWPKGAWAQERVRRVGVLMHTTSDEPETRTRITALAHGLQEAGWLVGRNLRIDTRWSSGDIAGCKALGLTATATGTPPKSAVRIFGARGNPQANNLFSVLGYFQKRAKVHLHVG